MKIRIFSSFSGLLLAIILLDLTSCVPVNPPTQGSGTQPVALRYDDHIYLPAIHTVLLYPSGNEATNVLDPAVTTLDNTKPPLHLSFDELNAEPHTYYAQLVHCSRTWEKSSISNMDYLDQFNEFPINTYAYAFDTRIPYIHYDFNVPKPKLSGNYLLVVYRDKQKTQPLLSKRFIVVESGASIQAKSQFSNQVANRNLNQQINFKVNYGGIESISPQEEFFVTIRQNYRWDNAIRGLKPTFIRNDKREMDYQFFNNENSFYAGNEFRFFDLTMVHFKGQRVLKVSSEGPDKPYQAYLEKTGDRSEEAYTTWEDLNGRYFIQNKERGQGNLQADYLQVHFALNCKKQPTPVYIFGELTQWQCQPENKMYWNEAKQQYEGSILLKQGFYNYCYYMPQEQNPFKLEGNHAETNNNYDLLLYYRSVSGRYDRVVAYQELTSP